jgi:hypothetical protein
MATFSMQIRSKIAMSDQMKLLSCVFKTQLQETYLMQINKWILELCKCNKCAAFLLAHFIVWHSWKARVNAYSKHLNDLAEKHGVINHV